MKSESRRDRIREWEIRIALTGIFLLLCLHGSGQETDKQKFSFSGNVRDLVTLISGSGQEPIWYNTLTNRLELTYYASDEFSLTAEARTRYVHGGIVRRFSDRGSSYGDFLQQQDFGVLNLQTTLVDKPSWVLHTMLDRMYADYQKDKWQIRLGRQRINWSKNFVWNPNDIFNSYSYFDFDYEKRPGSDALRVQYYRTFTSSIEFGFAPSENFENSTAAVKYGFNQWDYDFQLIGGVLRKQGLLGIGWSGYEGDLGLRGEVNYYRRLEDNFSTRNFFIASVSGNYIFSKDFSVHLEALYDGNESPVNFLNLLNSRGLRADNLSPFKYSLFGRAEGSLSPLWDYSFGYIYYPEEGLHFLSPSITYSVGENLELLLLGQVFTGSLARQQPGPSLIANDEFSLWALRGKWSF